MPRGTVIDLTAPDILDAVNILSSPPPAYTQLPGEAIQPRNEEASSSSGGDDSELLDSEGELSFDEGEEEYQDADREEGGEGRYLPDTQLVNDQDWENASGDLTKRYNRLRQHVGALAGEQALTGPKAHAYGANGSNNMPLPAQNQLHQQKRQLRTVADTSSATVPTGVHASKLASSLAALSHKYSSAINLAPVASTSSFQLQATQSGPSNFAEPSFTSNAATRKGGSERHNIVKDKSDRATNEQVLDPRTRLVLFKMLGRGMLEKIEGCVSTGKEANVYHALGRLQPDATPPSPLVDLAIKIYKTSILTFKSRAKYLTGEFRFKNGYSKVKNPRKMVRLWAEKEMRNLKRLHTSQIRCPEPVEVRGNVLVMTFLGFGEDGWQASPRLKEAELPGERLPELYQEMLHVVRRMYKICKLVHADLSEYNVLYSYSDGHLYIIDVSQSVEHDHPHAFDFLRSDIQNMDEFFSRRGVRTLGLQRTFGLVIESWDKNGEETVEEVGEEMTRRLCAPEEEDMDREAQDTVFKEAYIPRTLNEVYDPERDVQRVLKGEKDQLIYAEVARVVAPKTLHKAGNEQADLNGIAIEVDTTSGSDSAESEDVNDAKEVTEEESEGEEEEEEEEEEKEGPRQLRGKRHEDREAKKERKLAVKEEKREKRKDKIPKSVKKAKVKKTSGKKK